MAWEDWGGRNPRLLRWIGTAIGHLPHLQELEWLHSGVVELPDFSHFPRLRRLTVDHGRVDAPPPGWLQFALQCRVNHVHLEILKFTESPISELPDLRKFPGLKELRISGCHNLTSLTCSGPLLALESLHLGVCMSLSELLDVGLFPRLRSFEFRECGVNFQYKECVENLRSRGFLLKWERRENIQEFNIFECRGYFIPEISGNEIPLFGEVNSNRGVNRSLDGLIDLDANPWPFEVQPVIRVQSSSFDEIRVRNRYNWHVQKCRLVGNQDHLETHDLLGTFNLGPCIDEIAPTSEPKCNLILQLALNGSNLLDAGPSSMEVEPCSSEFIPYNESI